MPKDKKDKKDKETNYALDLMAEIGNEYASIVADGILGDCKTFIDTGSLTLNALFSGSLQRGAPGNKTIVIAGEMATGKTYIVLQIVKNFLDSNPKAFVFYFESEFALTTDMIESRGIDTKRFIMLPVATIQEFRTQSLKLMNGYLNIPEEKRHPMLLVLDSLGMLSSTKELEDSTEGKETADMTKARLIKSVVRTLTPKLGRANVSLLMTNHTYDVIGAYVPTKKMGGGGGPMYSASTIIFLSKSKIRDKESKEVTGNIITCTAFKSRFTKEQSKCQICLDFATGLNRFYGLVELGLKTGIVTKEGNRYVLPGGEKAFMKEILENPEQYFTEDVLVPFEEAAAAEYSYGVGSPVPSVEEDLEEEEEEVEDE